MSWIAIACVDTVVAAGLIALFVSVHVQRIRR